MPGIIEATFIAEVIIDITKPLEIPEFWKYLMQY
jgi:hypothetical protein